MLIERFQEQHAGTEFHRGAGRNQGRFAGSWVSPRAILLAQGAQGAKTPQTQIVALLQGLRGSLKQMVHHQAHLAEGQARLAGDVCD